MSAHELPYDMEAESTVLGSLIVSPEWADDAPDLSVRWFYAPVCQRLCDALVRIRTRGALPTGAELIAEFAGWQQLPEWRENILDWHGNAALSKWEFLEAVRLVRDTFMRRELIRLSSELRTAASGRGEGYVEPAAVISAAERTLSELARGVGGRDEWSSADTIAKSVMASVRAASVQMKPRGLPTGILRLDQFMGGMRPGDLIIVAGASSMGKTSLARNMAYSVAKAGGRVPFFSQEMTEEQLIQRTISAEARRGNYCAVPYRDMDNGTVPPREVDILDEVSARVTSRLIIDDASDLSVSDLRMRTRAAEKRLGGVDLIVVDYLQIMNIPQEKGDNRTVGVSRATKALKALAKEFSCPVIVLSQLSREYWKREGKRPQLVDLKESGSIENDADKVLFVHREGYFLERAEPAMSDHEAHYEWEKEMRAMRNRVEVIVGKNRMGRVGTVELWIDMATDLVLSDVSELARGEVIQMRGGAQE
jgi:replicative DNA helicase